MLDMIVGFLLALLLVFIHSCLWRVKKEDWEESGDKYPLAEEDNVELF